MIPITGHESLRGWGSLGEDAYTTDGADGFCPHLAYSVCALLLGRRLVSHVFTANQIGYPWQLPGDRIAGLFENEL